MAQGALEDGAGRRSAKTRGARRAVVSAMVAGLTFLAAACGPRNTEVGAMDAPAMVEVDNRAFLDANVYVLRSGQRIRLGTATGSSKTTFTLPRGLVSGVTQLSFLMDFVGSSRSPVSEEITVLPGDTVMLVVPPR